MHGVGMPLLPLNSSAIAISRNYNPQGGSSLNLLTLYNVDIIDSLFFLCFNFCSVYASYRDEVCNMTTQLYSIVVV